MANWDNMFLSCNNDGKFAEIMNGFHPNVRIMTDKSIGEPMTGRVFTSSPLPHEAVLALSTKNPEITFKAECSFDHDNYTKITTVEYRGGAYKEIGIKVDYLWPVEARFEGKIDEILTEKITEVFRRIDTVVKHGAEFEIDHYNDEVTVSAIEGDFKMVATKVGPYVEDIKFFKKKTTFQWDSYAGNECPF